MALFAIFVMTVVAVGTVVLTILSSDQDGLFSIKNLFMVTWLYYGFSIGVDLLTGAELPNVMGEADLMDPNSRSLVAFIMSSYITCGAAFLTVYAVCGRRKAIAADKQYDFRLPPGWVLVILHLAVASIFIDVFFGMSRMTRLAMAQSSTQYKFLCLLVPLTLALDIVIVVCSTGSRARLAWLLSVGLALLTGNRVHFLFTVIVAAYRWRPSIRGGKLLLMSSACGVVLFASKTAYSVVLQWWHGDQVTIAMVLDNLQMSFAALDAHASYLIAFFHMQNDSPLWMGTSYYEIPFYLTWPRFLGGYHTSTLAETYMWTHHADIAARGGAMAFSAVAEAWLNFGAIGAVLLGAFWGATARFFDSQPRGIAFYVLLLMTVRLFRSDFATLYKNWMIVWGTLFLTVFVGLAVYTIVTDASRLLRASQSRGRTRHLHFPPGGC